MVWYLLRRTFPCLLKKWVNKQNCQPAKEYIYNVFGAKPWVQLNIGEGIRWGVSCKIKDKTCGEIGKG